MLIERETPSLMRLGLLLARFYRSTQIPRNPIAVADS